MIANECRGGHEGFLRNAVQRCPAFPAHKHVVRAQVECQVKQLRKAVVLIHFVAVTDVLNIGPDTFLTNWNAFGYAGAARGKKEVGKGGRSAFLKGRVLSAWQLLSK